MSANAKEIPAGPWMKEPEIWDTAVLNGKACPGFCSFEVERSNKWDDKAAKGQHSQQRAFQGAEPAKGSLTIVFWTDEQYQTLLSDILPMIEPDPGKKKPDAVSITHAVAAARNVRAFTVDKVSGPERQDFDLRKFVVTWTEERPPTTQNASGKPGAGKAAGTNQLCSQLFSDYQLEKVEYLTEIQKANGGFFFDSDAKMRADIHGAAMNSLYVQMKALNCSQVAPSGSNTDP